MRAILAQLAVLFLAVGLTAPLAVAPSASGAQEPTPTPTTTVTVTTTPATATVTSTAAATAEATATVTATATATATPGGTPRVISAQPSPTDPSVIVVTGEGFAPGATVLLEGQRLETTVMNPTSLTAVVPPTLPPGVYNIVVANLGFPPSPPLPVPIHQITGETTLFVPVAIKRPPIDTTAMFVQNISTTPANVSVQFFDLSGFSAPQWTRTALIAPGEAAIVDLAIDPTVPPGFDGTAVITSPQPITAVVNHLITVDSAGLPPQPPGTEPPQTAPQSSAGAFTVAPGPPATQATVPVAFGGYHGYFTTISVQNTGPTPGTYTIALSRTGIPTPISTVQRTIAPNGGARIRLGPEVGVPPDFVGSVTITASGSTLAVAAETLHIETGVMLSYSGFPAGTNVVNTPLLFKNYNGWVSGAQVVNLSASPVLLNAQLLERDTPFPRPLPPRPLAPNESVTFYLPAIPDIPDEFVGSGVFTANGPIAVVVQHIHAERGAAMAYSGFGAGTPRVSVPVIFRDAGGWDTGIQVQNLGTSDAFVTVTYHLPGGISFSDTGLIAVRSSTTFYQGEHPALAPGTIGAATVTSAGGQPIVAIVNEVNYSRSGDSSMTYGGINY